MFEKFLSKLMIIFIIFLQSWITLLTFLVLTVPLLKFCSSGQMKAMNLLNIWIRLFTNQSCDQITRLKWKSKIKNSLNKFSFVLLLVIWSQSASILTKAFNGNLLKIYFNRKSIPLIQTLQDIYRNKEISIAANSVIFKSFIERIDESNELKRDILTRMIEFEEKFKYSEDNVDNFKEYFFKKLIDCEIIFMMPSGKAREFERFWKKEESFFQVFSHKYSHNYGNYLVAKINPLAKTLTLL